MLAPGTAPGQPGRHTCQFLTIAAATIGPVTEPIPISQPVARRFLALHHLLAPPRSLPARPDSVLRVVDRLGSLQFDPLDVAGRNHDLVLLARIAGYRREWTDALLYEERRLYETYNKGLSLVPTAELPWFRVTWDRQRIDHEGGTFDEHAPLVEELLERIRRDGPLSATDVETRASIDWYWRPTNQVRAILEALAEAGILALRRRDGNRRVYDLAERLFPADLLARREPARDAFRHKLLSRYRAHGLLGLSGSAEIWLGTMPRVEIGMEDGLPLKGAARKVLHAELVEAGLLTAVAIDGFRSPRFLLTGELPMLAAAGAEIQAEADLRDGRGPHDGRASRDAAAPADWWAGRPGGRDPGVAFLAPLDPYVWDRDFLRALHGFDYVWEVYVPEPKRRWGYYVLPILYGDRLVGRVEPRIDRRAGVLRVLGLWWETGFDPLGAAGVRGCVHGRPGRPRPVRGSDAIRVPTNPRPSPVRRGHPRTDQHGGTSMTAIRTAEAAWEGDLTSGRGTVSATSSGSFHDLPVSWAARTEAPEGKTSPEELLAAAHAACFEMALSGALGRGGTPPERLAVTAAVTFDKTDAGWRVVSSVLTVRGTVPGIDAAGFQAAAEATRDGCPISQALKGNVALSVEAALEG